MVLWNHFPGDACRYKAMVALLTWWQRWQIEKRLLEIVSERSKQALVSGKHRGESVTYLYRFPDKKYHRNHIENDLGGVL